MSSVDPSWPPPAPVRHRPHRVAYLFAFLLPLALVAVLAAPFGLVWAWARQSPNQPPAAAAATPDPARAGQPGVGDPYFPTYGSSGYDALSYQIFVDWDADRESLTGTTTITAKATQPLRSFFYDLALTTTSVTVNGAPATFAKRGFQDVEVTPAAPIAAGATFQVEVGYSGAPGRVKKGKGPWWVTGQEWTVAGEPESSAWWFPANDHPSDPARVDISVRVEAGTEVISIGRLESRDTGREQDFDTWHWVADRPVVTYATFLSIGQYDLRTGDADGRPFLYAVSRQLPADQRARAFATLEKSGPAVRQLEAMFGPYPFADLGGVVPAHSMWFGGLETQTRPVYDRRAILDEGFGEDLVVHELAHMWYGDNVTLRQWNDIFCNEAYASWAQWGYAERVGGPDANKQLNAAYERTRSKPAFWQVTMIDPGASHLFDAVYLRGPMALQALRNLIGDDAFFTLAREWGQRPGTRSLEEWMVMAQASTKIDLLPFFQAWIYSPTAPARTAANGFR